jgi:hypothetical protein
MVTEPVAGVCACTAQSETNKNAETATKFRKENIF